MMEAPQGEPQPLAAYDEAVRLAYAAAVESRWNPATRAPLREAAVAAVLAYATHSAAGRRFQHLLLDLAADASPSEVDAWGAETLRAVRLAATRALADPGKPHHRPRAQALLKRLDTMANPTLQAREQVLLALSRQRQALHHTHMDLLARGSIDERKPSALTVQAHLRLLGRLTELVRSVPRGTLTSAHTPAFLAALAQLQALISSGSAFEPLRLPRLFELVQLAIAPGHHEPALAPAMQALEAVRAHNHPGVLAARLELVELVFDVELEDLTPPSQAALQQHLADLARVAQHLTEIPAASLQALIFRLKQRLTDPGNDDIEPLIDAALACQERLEQARLEVVRALRERNAGTSPANDNRIDDDDARRLIAGLRRRQRDLDALAEALLGLRLKGLTAVDRPAVMGLLSQAELLAKRHDMEAASFDHAVRALGQQFEKPRRSRDPVWQAASAVMARLAAKRQALEVTLRGLTFDRHLAPPKRLQRQVELGRQAEALDQVKVVLGGVTLEAIAPDLEPGMLAALTALDLSLRQDDDGFDTARLRSALDAVLASLKTSRS